jgi:hypothetical protein
LLFIDRASYMEEFDTIREYAFANVKITCDEKLAHL